MDTSLKRTDTVFDIYKFIDKSTFYVIDKFDMFNPTKSVTNNAEKVVSYILNKYIHKHSWMDETLVIYYKDTLGDIDQIFWNIDNGNINCYFVSDVNNQKQKVQRQEYILKNIKDKKLQLIGVNIVV